MFADIFQVPVEVPDGSELGALGAAVAAAVACGIYDTYESAVAAMCRVVRRHEPNPEMAAVYASRYQRYLKYVDALKSCV